MKIMITTTQRPNTIASYYSTHLSSDPSIELIRAYTFDLEDNFFRKGFSAKVKVHIRPQVLTKLVSAYLDELVQKHKPDALLVIKGQFINPALLKKLKKQEVYLINYNPDHPLYFEINAPGNDNVKKSIELYDLVFTYSPVIEKEIIARFPSLKTALLPFGYEDSNFSTNTISTNGFFRKVCFAGTADRTRAEFIMDLIKNKIDVDVYGSGFNRYLNSKSTYLTIYPEIEGFEYFSTLQKYIISLNLYRHQNKGSHNMRSFEIPAVGGIELVEYSDQMDRFFKNHQEVFLYKNSKEMYSMIGDISHYSDSELMELKNTIRSKTLNSKFSYKDRAREFMQVVHSTI